MISCLSNGTALFLTMDIACAKLVDEWLGYFLEDEWHVAFSQLDKLIYSIQSLLDEPNPDNFLNERAALLFKENVNQYKKTVKEYISLFANYSKYIETINNLDIKIKRIGEEND